MEAINMVVIEHKFDLEIYTPHGILRVTKKEWDCLVSVFKTLPSWQELQVLNNVRMV